MSEEERQVRIHHHMYETNEGILEHAERICELEGLVFDALSSLLSLVWLVNEHAGCERMEPSSPATIYFRELQRRARKLEVPNV